MHIPDNYLSPSTCATFGAAMIPIWRRASIKIKKEVTRQKMPLLGVSAAFSFLTMMFNIPLPGGTTGHAVGGALAAILLGPYSAVIAVTISLVIQALFFGDGGVLALGVNCFNMAFIMPFTAYYIFNFIKKVVPGKKAEYIGALASGYISVNFAALFAAIEFGVQPLLFKDGSGLPLYSPYGLNVSIPAMIIPHLLVVGVLEAIITAGVYGYVRKVSPEVIYKGSVSKIRGIFIIALVIILATPLGLLASGTAWGEWDTSEISKTLGFTPKGMEQGVNFNAPMQGYGVSGIKENIGYILSAIAGVILIIILFKIISKINLKKRTKGEE
ncbi:cobalt transporter CbiM [Clostridium sp. 'White wine YQ']|uniref:cobalt transporter CbiM n=1 Tax=Clostridium sp. 'White wine YQ' TaxID=3027474 RepID=UPI00236595A5|nr:cobalt transporter CbiM [Clostridium sp. 'White wine YQ']MDD7792837.1 cobalt transporter CbiM [Clostridium sp. 'White wine YQ']